MTPREEVRALMAETQVLIARSAMHDEHGNKDASLAALDQAEAACREALKIARTSGDPDLERLWPA